MKKRVLFICSQNKFRSATAHEMFRHSEKIEVDSAGTEKDARGVVEPDHIEWADIIYVMEERHVRRLKKMFGEKLKGKRVVNLGIPDIYEYMESGLVEELRSKLKGLY
jgi:protein-tyrosine phosphatase